MSSTADRRDNGASENGPAIGERSGRLMRIASYASVSVAGTLVVLKILAWLVTDSVALLSSLVDSLLDIGASAINLFAIRHALTPADREHRFGHGKAEYIAGLGQAAFISGSAVFLMFEAGSRFVHPRPIENLPVGIWVMVVSIILTLGLVQFQSYVVRVTGSVAISADRLHYRSDLLVNMGIIIALLLATKLEWNAADPLFAVAIALYILYLAWALARRSFDMLMDREFADEDRERIREIALAHPEVHGVHDLRTRSAGSSSFIQFHLVLASEIPLLRAHEISDEVEANVLAEFPAAEVIIHQDPEGIEEDTPTFGQ